MKRIPFLAAMAVLASLTARAQQCAITPSSFVLQENKTQVFTVPNTCTTPITWSCTPIGSCGSLTGTTTKTTYTAPGSVKAVTITATPHSGTAGTATVQVNAVQINALGITNGGQAATDFSSLILGSSNTQVSGYMAMLPWSTGDNGGASGTNCQLGVGNCPGLDAFDGSVAALFPNGVITKKINIVVTPLTGGGAIGGTKPNTDTPQFVLNEVTSYQNCGYSNTPGGTGFPDVMGVVNSNFQAEYKRFINIVLNHYANSTTSALSNYIGYIRFGLSAGGEVYPFCETAAHYDDTFWETYVEGMMDYISTTEAGVPGQSHPPIQIMTAVNAEQNPTDNGPAQVEAAHANPDKIGFGSEGLQRADLANYPACTSDWCNLFGMTYTNSEPFELQTTLQSDPVDANQQTGSLCRLVPFATFYKANILELYGWDLLYTYDSAKFCASPNGLNGVPGSNYDINDFCNTTTHKPKYSNSYNAVITSAVSGGAGSNNPPQCTLQ